MTRKNGMKDVKQVFTREKERGNHDDDGSCIIIIIIKWRKIASKQTMERKRWERKSRGREKVERKEVKKRE